MKPHLKTMTMPAVLSALLMLSGCSTDITGEYACDTPMVDMHLTLQPGGKLTSAATMFGKSIEKAGTYAVDGDKLTATVDGSSQVFTVTGDTLDGGIVKCKRE